MSTVHLVKDPSQVRQGDVLITPVKHPVRDSDIGKLVKENEKARVVLAYGEVTDHAHALYHEMDVAEGIAEPVPNPVRLFEINNISRYSDSDLPDQKLLRLNTRSLLRHEEHETISLPPCDYIVTHQFEGDEYEELRRVHD